MAKCSHMLLCSLGHCAVSLLWVLHAGRRPERGAGVCGTVYAEVLCLPSRSKGGKSQMAQVYQGFSSLSAKAVFG